MGMIVSSKIKSENNIVLELLLDYQEALQLQGQIDNVHIFSDNITHNQTFVSTRGKKGTTKYFLIPKQLRHGVDFEQKINCQKIDLPEKIIFIYSVCKTDEESY
tara:strand:- start:23823 stop:24134 length:312 start_codon:yes stop_codon:yes gene_type:complete